MFGVEDQSIVKTYDYINRVVITLPLSVYEGTWTILSPLVAMHHLDRSCMIVGIFLKLLRSPNSGIRAKSMHRCYMHEYNTKSCG